MLNSREFRLGINGYASIYIFTWLMPSILEETEPKIDLVESIADFASRANHEESKLWLLSSLSSTFESMKYLGSMSCLFEESRIWRLLGFCFIQYSVFRIYVTHINSTVSTCLGMNSTPTVHEILLNHQGTVNASRDHTALLSRPSREYEFTSCIYPSFIQFQVGISYNNTQWSHNGSDLAPIEKFCGQCKAATNFIFWIEVFNLSLRRDRLWVFKACHAWGSKL